MQPEIQYNLNRNFELRVVILALVVLLFFLGRYTQQKYDENTSLKSSLELLESTIENRKQKNQQRFDSLQQHIQQQELFQLQLKDSLVLLGQQRLHLKTLSDENKAAIHRIRDVDSLRAVVTKRYK